MYMYCVWSIAYCGPLSWLFCMNLPGSPVRQREMSSWLPLISRHACIHCYIYMYIMVYREITIWLQVCQPCRSWKWRVWMPSKVVRRILSFCLVCEPMSIRGLDSWTMPAVSMSHWRGPSLGWLWLEMPRCWQRSVECTTKFVCMEL